MLDQFKNIKEGLLAGDTRMLSKAITLAESTIPEQHKIALDIIEEIGPQKNTKRIGITGSPGVGKSTFIDALGQHIMQEPEAKLAVLSIDPSSRKSSGSILGDKTRMDTISNLPNVYIRPSASGNQLGGLAQNTRLAILLCEAAGFNHIIVESVGVGQGETEISQLTDCFVLLLNPGGGDELQGIKRGIMEMADFVLVNKLDQNETLAKTTAKEYSMALHLMTPKSWEPKVLMVSSTENSGIGVFWDKTGNFFDTSRSSELSSVRHEQKKYWAKKTLQELMIKQLDSFQAEIESRVDSGGLPEIIAHQIFKNLNK